MCGALACGRGEYAVLAGELQLVGPYMNQNRVCTAGNVHALHGVLIWVHIIKTLQ